MDKTLHNNVYNNKQQDMEYQLRASLVQQSTLPTASVPPVLAASLPPVPVVSSALSPQLPIEAIDTASLKAVPVRKRSFTRLFALALILGLALAIYFIWQPAPTLLASNSSAQNNVNAGANSASNSGGTGDVGSIEVYVLGAVKTPGLYTLPVGARVYDLIKAAGGTLPKANLVALNMAAKLSDGEEVYVTMVGETPPTYSGGVPGLSGGNSTPTTSGTSVSGGGTGSTGTGQLVNINTAGVSDLMQNLHISSKTAQAIVDFRTQNGNYTSVQQLLQVVSRSIYDKIRNECTV